MDKTRDIWYSNFMKMARALHALQNEHRGRFSVLLVLIRASSVVLIVVVVIYKVVSFLGSWVPFSFI